MIHAVIDTNVWVSGLNFGGVPGQLLSLVAGGRLHISISPPLVDELSRVLRERFQWREYDFQRRLDPLLGLATMVRPRRSVDIAADPDDNRVIECALSAQASVIVNGDDHLLRLGQVHGVEVVSPREFLGAISA